MRSAAVKQRAKPCRRRSTGLPIRVDRHPISGIREDAVRNSIAQRRTGQSSGGTKSGSAVSLYARALMSAGSFRMFHRVIPSLPVVALAVVSACFSPRRPDDTSAPRTLLAQIPLDSARRLLLLALEAEKLTVDGTPLPTGNVVTSTFTVRRGGVGESEIRLRLRLARDGVDGANIAATLLFLDATAREKNRLIAMSPEAARSPTLRRDPHPINPNDREALGRIARLIQRLWESGFVVTGAPRGAPSPALAQDR